MVPYSPQHNIVGNKWVFKIKLNSDGIIERYKATLVAKCFHQNPGVDFSETFSPMVKYPTNRTILALAVDHGWDVKRLDVNIAFLNKILQEDVFMVQPKRFVDPKLSTNVCKIKKALYGLRQGSRVWFERLKQTLLEWGFQSSKSDAFLFVYKSGDTLLLLLVYVDDILVIGMS